MPPAHYNHVVSHKQYSLFSNAVLADYTQIPNLLLSVSGFGSQPYMAF
ncbi:hypothetical protein NNO_0195 [Hydrogenimonas sp.]|nr:hypothetical protein NNO_0195 [Hydrogenimonas sp.]